ncbi:MAG: hypothetical protein M1831_003160 [Alyxoria varia]|nr:MAG: hypothetical protein M1831_003160 [Alyxoria varia]
MNSFKDKVAIITGTASGIGLQTSKDLLEFGASVLGVDINEPPVELTASSNYRFFKCNIASDTAAKDIVKACTDAFGPRVDILLNIAGVLDLGQSVDRLDDDVWDRTIAINLTAPTKLIRAATRNMVEQKTNGAIVNVASIAGTCGAAAGTAYTASKHGILGVTKNTAWRFRNDGIRCNVVCPGAVKTNIINTVPDLSRFDQESQAVWNPFVKLHNDLAAGEEPRGTPQQLSKLIGFLASDASYGINGAVIPIDHGWSTA